MPAQSHPVAAKDTPTGGPPKTLDDVVAWASWTVFAAATGVLDDKTAREVNRSLTTLRMALEKRDLEKRVHELERELKPLRKKADDQPRSH